MATTTTTTPFNLTSPLAPTLPRNYSLTPLSLPHHHHHHHHFCTLRYDQFSPPPIRKRLPTCKATEVSVAEESSPSGGGGGGGEKWVPVVPLGALPRGERRVIIQEGETILLLWYKDEVFAIENRSPAEGAYSEGLINAKLTKDGCIVCPTTDSTFDLRTGALKEWYPKNPVLRALTPALRNLFVYPVKTDEENIYISMSGGLSSDASAEIIRMVVDEGQQGFGFIKKNEIINGKAAVIGFLLLLDFELLTGKGLLKGTGFLDFLYAASKAFK
ncbi:hypothetical protein CFP56_012864 [Quercus suber]|uniref:Rieske domain-containing protein n=1 Tax=Quercus suber TaxID=58331 RepID=A0AAW0KWG4_QUESU